MQKIIFPRKSVSGCFYTKKEIEDWYISNIETKNIRNNLSTLKNTYLNKPKEQRILSFLIKHLDYIILAPPRNQIKLCVLADRFSRDIHNKKNFYNKILNIFGYNKLRKKLLIELAERMNYKTCAYCNSQFTLYVSHNHRKSARFQYDHFFNKSKYPFLSISLYNLIPSCPICNNVKGSREISTNDLLLHPYENNIADLFDFKISDGLIGLYLGITPNIKITLQANKNRLQDIVNNFNDLFQITGIYERHHDIIEDLYEKVYKYKAYIEEGNFNFLDINFSKNMRLFLGTYIEKNEIEKRPLTKFTQDIWKQLLSLSGILR